MSAVSIYQIKITLSGSKPPIWRRVLVRGDTTLGKLHDIIQAVMGWLDYHLHLFTIDGVHFGVPSPDDWEPVLDERKIRLDRIVPGEGTKFIYEYDFGDSWDHVLLVEKIMPSEQGVAYPACIKGRRACPPEDVGGIWGYYGFLEAIQDPGHPEHDDYLEWIGGEFDPERFDLDETDAALQRLR
ncbi:MAG: plasmid pRiA4b ORF-3 family protein [Anaerolineae bacterium]|nr:plasmid pRiA4b ORF-3 family protein [Anaerolineae bacterium]